MGTDSGAGNRGLTPEEAAAVDTYFDGDREFYLSFRATTLSQFVVDLREGDAACRAQDAAALRRVAHNLKGVLRTLGYDAHSACAREAEIAAQQTPWDAAEQAWLALRARLVQAFILQP